MFRKWYIKKLLAPLWILIFLQSFWPFAFFKSAGPPLKGCHRAAKIALTLQLQPSILSLGYDREIINSSLVRIQSAIFTMDLAIWSHSGAAGWPWKTLNFQACLQGSRSQKNHPQGLRKTPKSTSNHKKRFLPKHSFCNTLFTKTLT